MPHSSGGGSHSGGSSSGSSSSYSSSHSGGSSSSSRPTRTYFPGAYRYVRYHDGGMDYVYSTDSTLNQPAKSVRWVLIFFYIPFFIMSFLAGYGGIQFPRKMDVSYAPTVEIVDTIGRLQPKEYAQIEKSADMLYEAIGVPIEIRIEDNSVWKDYYVSLTNYAFDVYVNTYTDEDHWLIIYSDDGIDRQDPNAFSDWYFEGMQGDNTDPYLREQLTSAFNDDMYKALLDKRNTLGDAFEYAFGRMVKNAGKISIDWDSMGSAIGISIFLIVHMYILVFHDPNKKYRNYAPCGRDTEEVARSKEVRCSYCGGVYYKGTVISCPHCGAPLEMTSTSAQTNWKPPKGFDM